MGQSPCLPWKGEAEGGEPSIRSRFYPGGSLPPFYQKTLETRSREDLLDQRFQEMNRQIEELRNAPTAYGEDICTDPPFSQMIMQEPIPPNFKLPQFESYDGTLDPVDHLEAFRTMMLLHGVPDAILCRAFPSTLDRKSTRLNSSHSGESRMPSSA